MHDFDEFDCNHFAALALVVRWNSRTKKAAQAPTVALEQTNAARKTADTPTVVQARKNSVHGTLVAPTVAQVLMTLVYNTAVVPTMARALTYAVHDVVAQTAVHIPMTDGYLDWVHGSILEDPPVDESE